MDLVWLVCLRPLGCHLLNFFEISGREFRSSAVKLRPKANIGKFPRRPVFVSAFDAPARRCAGKTSFFAPIYLTLMKLCQNVDATPLRFQCRRWGVDVRRKCNAMLAESCRIFGPVSARGPSRWCSQGAPPGRHFGGSDHHLWYY